MFGPNEHEWREIPTHLRGSLERYVNDGIPVGGFLEAVLTNNLRLAVGRADHINSQQLKEIVYWLNMRVPHSCWGSVEAYRRWMELGGLNKILGARGNDHTNTQDKDDEIRHPQDD